MKAIVYTEFGPPEVLHLAEAPKPAPKDNEVLIRVQAAPVAYGDLTARNFKNITAREFNMPLPLLLPMRLVFGTSKPKINILGSEFAGVIEAVGAQVTRFKPGDPVMGYLGQRMGAYAEYVCMPEDGLLALKPKNMSYVEAAAVPYGAIMASSLLRKGNIKPGYKVLINGASGGIGSAALQLAKNYGAEVTGVCGTERLEYIKSLGADHVVDYTKEDFTKNGQTYDLIFDVLGKSSFARVKNSLKPGGIYLMASFKTKALFQMLWTRFFGDKKVVCALASEKAEDLVSVKELIEAGKYRSIVDLCYPVEQAAEAHRYAESGLHKGPVVIMVEPTNHS
jgi:NADPH:quinone reductase-like Zn-dependent oxidoreductase